jgi:hypothetical protein
MSNHSGHNSNTATINGWSGDDRPVGTVGADLINGDASNALWPAVQVTTGSLTGLATTSRWLII